MHFVYIKNFVYVEVANMTLCLKLR